MSFQPPKGTDDIGAPQSSVWRLVLGDWEEWSARYGYPLVMTPIFESTELFQRGVGDTSEVVTKQMYTFTDRGGRSVTLRPEGTAGVVRAFLDSGAQGAWKGAYSGPMFRYERPQGGRRRQFWQVGVEYLDVEAPSVDVEVIELGYRYLTAVGVPALEVRLNSLGDGVCRPGYVDELRTFLRSRSEILCEESRGLVESNPLRVLDCKICGPELADAPTMADRLCDACSAHFVEVKETLTRLEVPFIEDHRLVRGLDYYTRTAFEYIATRLDTAQNAVGGGGRYDGLAETLGGRRAPGVGFALGVDRIILAAGRDPAPAVEVFIVSEVPPAEALVAASQLRNEGLAVDLDVEGRAIKTQFRAAGRSGAPVTLVLRSLEDPVDVRTGGWCANRDGPRRCRRMVEGPHMMRTHHSGSIGEAQIGEKVTVAGWIQRRRDHGGIAFLDVRDASGIIQVVADPAVQPEVGDLRMEYCVSVTGTVRRRPEGTENPEMTTGTVEIGVDEIVVLSAADALPFMIDDRTEVDERARLRYRYLDLRRPRMAANLRARSRATAVIRRTLDEQGFLEVETPTLINSTPEGARDMLVPSRLRSGEFYALPQSPQLFKQLLMISGVERYFQIARCYRDEDFRADRQLEFTQLDLEGSFWGRDDVHAAIESVLVAVVAELRGVAISQPFARLTWQEAMDRYGSDKPDLRFGMEIRDLSAHLGETEFGVFKGALESGGTVRGINIGAQEWPRSRADAVTERAKELGAKGLVWMVVEDDGSLRSPVSKFLSPQELDAVKGALEGGPGDVLLVAADKWKTCVTVLGGLRTELGKPEGHDELAFLWVVDFPLFEVAEDGSVTFSHHPFTSPVSLDEMRDNPLGAMSNAYDVVVNGIELGSGSVRIHDPVVQRQVFEILGIDSETAEKRFGWFLEALRYGTPPHAGFAFGIDRLVMVLQSESSIREVIPFPKTQTGMDPMTGAPTWVDDAQLGELGIALTPEARARLAESENPAVISESDLDVT